MSRQSHNLILAIHFTFRPLTTWKLLETKNGMNASIYWKNKKWIKVAQQPQKPLDKSNQILAMTSVKKNRSKQPGKTSHFLEKDWKGSHSNAATHTHNQAIPGAQIRDVKKHTQIKTRKHRMDDFKRSDKTVSIFAHCRFSQKRISIYWRRFEFHSLANLFVHFFFKNLRHANLFTPLSDL